MEEEQSGEGMLFPLETPFQGSKPLFPYSAGSLFPISQVKPQDSTAPAWLANASFSEPLLPPRSPVAENVQPEKQNSKQRSETLSSGESTDHELDDAKKSRKRNKEKEREDRHRKRHKKREEKQLAEDTVIGALKGSHSERKASGDVWIRDTSWQKDYYFDTRGDRDNLVFESLSRHDVAKYHPHPSKGVLDSGILWKRKTGLLDPESDTCMHDETLKAGGRYWSPKVASLQRRRDFKRLQLASQRSKRIDQELCESFVSLELGEGEEAAEKPKEESWDDYVLKKTRKFSQLTHDKPQNESFWFQFAKFQDELIRAETRKTSVHLAIDKKIMILERALEHHPDSEDLILLFLETSKRRDDITTLLSKWERMLFKHSGSYRLWWEYLKLRRSTFSKFSVSAVRKLYSQALQALAAARTRQYHRERLGGDNNSSLVEAERGLVTIYMDMCRFEWQSGHHELAIGLLQAQLEYSFLCPLIQLSQSNKLRLFEAFWKSGAPRIGEPGSDGWSTWMQREEEQIQKARDMTRQKLEDDSTWAGWKETHIVEDTAQATDMGTTTAAVETDSDDNEDNEETQIEDDAALLEKLGLNLDLAKDVEVKDSRTWKRWSEEESQRDRDQWLPIKPTSETRAGEASELEDDEGLEKMVMFDDIRENLVSVATEEAKLHFLGQFLEFCNAPLFQWCCSNFPGYKERFDSLENLTSDAHSGITSCQSWGDLLFPTDWIKECQGRASFVRNAVLLLRDSFSNNLHFQEVLISLEAMDACEKNETSDGSAAARSLAKKLLKASRRDLMLCAAYASFEASTGNVDVARKVFDASLAALPKEAQPSASIIYLAYAEVEMAQSADDYSRVLYILYCLGVAEPFRPNFSRLTGPQVLKAYRGYQEQLQKLFKLGKLTESGASLVICAALFQQLTAGWEAAKLVFEQSLASLSGDQQNVHYERVLHCHLALLESQKNWVKPTDIRQFVKEGIARFPFNLKLLSSYRNSSLMSGTRRLIDELAQRNPSSVLWLFALSCELSHPGVSPRIHNVFERALEAGGSPQCVLLWRLYIAYELRHNNPEGARRVFFRAIHACPWSKALWIDGFQKMSAILSVKELSDLVDIMRDKELRIRTDVYEILLEEVA